MKRDKIMKTNGQHKGNGVGRPKSKIDEKILDLIDYSPYIIIISYLL